MKSWLGWNQPNPEEIEKQSEQEPDSQPFNVGDYCRVIEVQKPLQVETAAHEPT